VPFRRERVNAAEEIGKGKETTASSSEPAVKSGFSSRPSAFTHRRDARGQVLLAGLPPLPAFFFPVSPGDVGGGEAAITCE